MLTLNAADGKPLAQSRRLLLAVAGNVENTGMGWNADHTSVGTKWGSAPTICEGIAARITLATGSKSCQGLRVGWRRGARRRSVGVSDRREALF